MRGGPESQRGRFYVGGFPEQDLIQDLINRVGLFGSFLRGYLPGAFSGDVFHQASFEYRLPIWDIFRGPGTLPVYLERLSGSIFSDTALIWEGALDPDAAFKASVGAEVQLSATLLYGLPMTFRFGYAHALRAPIADLIFFVLGGGF